MKHMMIMKGNQRHKPLDGQGDRGEGKNRLHPDGGYVKSKVKCSALLRGNQRHAPMDGNAGPKRT